MFSVPFPTGRPVSLPIGGGWGEIEDGDGGGGGKGLQDGFTLPASSPGVTKGGGAIPLPGWTLDLAGILGRGDREGRAPREPCPSQDCLSRLEKPHYSVSCVFRHWITMTLRHCGQARELPQGILRLNPTVLRKALGLWPARPSSAGRQGGTGTAGAPRSPSLSGGQHGGAAASFAGVLLTDNAETKSPSCIVCPSHT